MTATGNKAKLSVYALVRGQKSTADNERNPLADVNPSALYCYLVNLGVFRE